MLGPLLIFQRRLHRELQMALLLITRHQVASMWIFSLLFLPGVALHELSHFLAAQLLMVRTGKLSLIPQIMPGGQLRMGYVETAPADWLRDSLIGVAPLLSGGAVIAYLGSSRLGLPPVVTAFGQGNWDALWLSLLAIPQQNDFWLWFYLAFAVSSTMLPSASDRRAWLPLILIVVGLAAAALLAGAGPWLLAALSAPLNRLFEVLTTVFGFSLALHLILLVPAIVLRRLLNRVTGLTVAGRT